MPVHIGNCRQSARFGAVFVCAILWGSQDARANQLYDVTFPDLALKNDERVVGIKFSVNPGQFASLRNIPPAWWLSIENPEGDTTVLTGGIRLGAAAFTKSDARAHLNQLLRIITDDMACSPNSEAKSCEPFSATAEIHVTSDFEHERVIEIKTSDLKFTPISPGSESDRR